MGVPQKLELADRPPVAKLMYDIGFKELTCGDADEAVIKYGPKDGDRPVDLEFLCGKSGLSTEDQERAAYAVQEGLYNLTHAPDNTLIVFQENTNNATADPLMVAAVRARCRQSPLIT